MVIYHNLVLHVPISKSSHNSNWAVVRDLNQICWQFYICKQNLQVFIFPSLLYTIREISICNIAFKVETFVERLQLSGLWGFWWTVMDLVKLRSLCNTWLRRLFSSRQLQVLYPSWLIQDTGLLRVYHKLSHLVADNSSDEEMGLWYSATLVSCC